jgi:hypothetical protein
MPAADVANGGNVLGPHHHTESKGKPTNMQKETEPNDTPDSAAPEDQPGEPGAEGGSQSDAKDKLPAAPSDDDSPLGDTDQHSNA